MEHDQEKWTTLKDAVDGEWIARQARAMVEIPSVTMQEAEVCRYYADQLAGLGFAVDKRQVTPGRDNLYARLAGAENGPSLMLNGHLDTIPTGDCVPCRLEGDRLYGRGATDMKGAMAAMLGALRALKETGFTLGGDLWLTAIVGHEEPEADKDGPLALIEDRRSGRIGGDRILIGEGWDELWVMSMGSMVFEILLTSPRGGTHTTYVPFKQNPIRYVGDLIQRIAAYQEELDGGVLHPLAGAERIDVGTVEAGDYFNRTPVQCRLTGTLRWGPRARAGDVLAELRRLAAPIAEAVLAGKRIVGDANLFVNLGGVPAFYYGPSNETAHSDGEWVSLTRLEQAAQVFALTAAAYCGLSNGGA